MTDDPWYDNHQNISLLVQYLVYEQRFDQYELAAALAKPWKYEAEFKEAETRRLVQFS